MENLDLDKVSIQKVEAVHFKSISSISDTELGIGYVQQNELAKFINNPNKIGFVAIYNNEVIGFTLSIIIQKDQLSRIVLKDLDWFKNYFLGYSLIGYRKHTVVKKGYQRQGIGDLLMKKSLVNLNKKVSVSFSVGWQNGEIIAIKNLLEKHGYTTVRRIDNYWKKDSLVKNYACPACGNPPCICAAGIYVKNIT